MYWLPISFLFTCITILAFPPMDNFSDEQKQTIDGPYVFYTNDSVIVHQIDSASTGISLRRESYDSKEINNIKLQVQTDIPGKTFEVTLRQKHKAEKSVYTKAKKIVALSDIEGNFSAFRKLLQATGVIDENLNWIYGDGHLVLTGDFVDRGDMVMEVLWLIYALEPQAEKAKGKVHFILGNHEQMNMSGDLAYVHEKYMKHAALMNTKYIDHFGKNTAIGQWMATKNIVERVGNMLFVHGGYSSLMNTTEIPLEMLNEKAQPWYADTSFNYPEPLLQLIFSDMGPLWYRGYYYGNSLASTQQIDSTLAIYNVKHIVTGHTVIAHQIVSLHDGKLINTDVHHSQGHSEALVVEGNKKWRVNQAGDRMAIAEKQMK